MASAIWCFPMPTKSGGRPPKDAGDQATKQVRLFTDVAEMVADLADVLGKSTAQICDPFIRGDIGELWKEHKTRIDRMKELRAEQAKLRIESQEKAKPKRKG